MAVEDVLDDGEAEARSALLAAGGGIDPVEPFGQARQVLGSDARALVAHRDLDLRRPVLLRRQGVEGDRDPAAVTTIFHGVLDQVLDHPQDLVPVAQHAVRPGRGVERDGDAALAGDRPQRIGDLAGERHDVDPLRRRHVDAQLDARERQEVVDQPRHAQGLHPHDAEEALPRLGVVPGRALQGLDEAEQRSEGRAQLVAGIGDEIDPHRLEALGRGEVAQEQHDVRPGPPGLAALHRADLHLEGALGRHPRRIERLQRLAGA